MRERGGGKREEEVSEGEREGEREGGERGRERGRGKDERREGENLAITMTGFRCFNSLYLKAQS